MSKNIAITAVTKIDLLSLTVLQAATVFDAPNESNIVTLMASAIFTRPPSAPTGIVVGHCVRSAGRLSVPPSVCLSVRPSSLSVRPDRRHHSNSLRISATSLIFGGMMQVPWGRLLFKMTMLGQFLCVPRKVWNFPLWPFFNQVWGTTLSL